MFTTHADIAPAIEGFEGDFNKLVVVEKHPDYPEGLVFQNLRQDSFNHSYREFLSRHSMISEISLLSHFVGELEKDGYKVVFLDSCRSVLEDFERWSQPLEIPGFQIPGGGNLYPFQQFALRKAIEKAGERWPKNRLFFFGFGTGTGKSLLSSAGAQALFNEDKIDLVIAFTMRSLKINLCRNFNNTTQLKAVVIEGDKSLRRKKYEAEDFDVLVTNYEKCHYDHDELEKLVKGKRVLWVMDETQKVIYGDGSPTLARKGLDKLVKTADSTVWPMSASVVSQTPLRYRDVFSLHGRPGSNILGPKYAFEDRYLESKIENTFVSRKGGRFTKTDFVWDNHKLQELRHRVSPHVQAVRKTDPGVKEIFKGMQTVIHPIQMSEKDRKLYEIVEEKAQEAMDEGFAVTDHLRILRYICNTPEALAHSESDLAQELVKEHPDLITSKNSAKVEAFLDQVESIAEAGEKVVAFTQFTNLTLFMLQDQLRKRKINFVIHYGYGMTDKEAQAAQDKFKSDDDVTLFLSSDAGAHGLSFQEARFVINYDVPYSYDLLMQRGDRINRADSYLDGLTSYIYVTDNTVEERILQVNNSRRKLASVTQGTNETLSTNSAADSVAQEQDESTSMSRFVLFGEDSFSSNSLG